MDNILDHVVVQGQRYDIVSPTAFGDNIETIGSACINPDGYAQGSTFLARLGNEQFYYEATAAITQGSSILEGTNCKKTTVTGREAELASEIETLGETVDSLNEALSTLKNKVYEDGIKNIFQNTATSETKRGATFNVLADGKVIVNRSVTTEINVVFTVGQITGVGGSIKLSGAPSSASGTTYLLALYDETASTYTATDIGNGATATLNENHVYSMSIIVRDYIAVSNAEFRPMITDANAPNSDYAHYVPYAMTNRELTEGITPLLPKSSGQSTQALTAETGWDLYNTWVARSGNVVHIGGNASYNSNISTGTSIKVATLKDTSIAPKSTERIISGCGTDAWTAYNPCYMIIDMNGGIYVTIPTGVSADNINFNFTYII